MADQTGAIHETNRFTALAQIKNWEVWQQYQNPQVAAGLAVAIVGAFNGRINHSIVSTVAQDIIVQSALSMASSLA